MNDPKKPNTLAAIAVKAIIQFVTNIITMDPKNKVMFVTKAVILSLILIPIVSTSFVTLDKTSPVS